MITIRLDSHVPIERQIQAEIRRLIARAEVRVGDSLPTVRQLAADLGVNLNTVARSYRALEADGLVSTVRGRGTKVTANAEMRHGTAREVRARVAAGIREALADARLAGFTRPRIEALLAEIVIDFWPPETGR